MTPLAAYLAKQLVARPKHREHIWVEPKNLKSLRSALDDIHCFEVTACLPLFDELATTFKDKTVEDFEPMFAAYSFLPAPKTWIEWKHVSGNRVAVLVEERKEDRAVATFFSNTMAENMGYISTKSGDYYDFGGDRYLPEFIAGGMGAQAFAGLLSLTQYMLVLINSPRIIGRKQHMPNAGLERRLTKGLVGASFPLRAWTEVLLQVSKVPEIDDGEPHEAHLTGTRALHFVRKHIRIRLGRLEYVTSHWRGDPSLGIKQTRYTVTP